MVQSKAEFFTETLLEWGEANRRWFPWRETDSPYRMLVSEVLLQQTLATKVSNVYNEFFSKYPKPSELAAAKEAEIADIIRPCGLQNRKAPALIEMGRILASDDAPRDYESLLELPFVNQYAANATLSFAFDEPRAIVDANVVRIFNRYFGKDFQDDQDSEAWDLAESLISEGRHRDYNMALLDFGASICIAGNPRCSQCPLVRKCQYAQSKDSAPM